MGPTIKIIRKSEIWQKLENLAYSKNLSIRRAPREANNLGIFTLTIRLSSNFVKIHTSGVNRINIWVLGPGDTANNYNQPFIDTATNSIYHNLPE